jgi:hypothetical protein
MLQKFYWEANSSSAGQQILRFFVETSGSFPYSQEPANSLHESNFQLLFQTIFNSLNIYLKKKGTPILLLYAVWSKWYDWFCTNGRNGQAEQGHSSIFLNIGYVWQQIS